MIIALEVIAFVSLCHFVYLVGTVAAGRTLGMNFDEVTLFIGPKLASYRRKEVEYRLCALPLGSYVRFERTGFERENLAKQIAVILAGSITIMSLAAACLSVTPALN